MCGTVQKFGPRKLGSEGRGRLFKCVVSKKRETEDLSLSYCDVKSRSVCVGIRLLTQFKTL